MVTGACATLAGTRSTLDHSFEPASHEGNVSTLAMMDRMVHALTDPEVLGLRMRSQRLAGPRPADAASVLRAVCGRGLSMKKDRCQDGW